MGNRIGKGSKGIMSDTAEGKPDIRLQSYTVPISRLPLALQRAPTKFARCLNRCLRDYQNPLAQQGQFIYCEDERSESLDESAE